MQQALPCEKVCAISLLPLEVTNLSGPEDSEDDLEIVIPLSTNDLCMETVKENFVIAFTDGACTHQSIPCLRRAGFGVAFDKDLKHPRAVSKPLSGSEQSAQRAEVRAILAALQIENRPLHIFSDGSYAVDQMQNLLNGMFLSVDGEHIDLWKRIQILLSLRYHPLQISWTKGHISQDLVDNGLFLQFQ